VPGPPAGVLVANAVIGMTVNIGDAQLGAGVGVVVCERSPASRGAIRWRSVPAGTSPPSPPPRRGPCHGVICRDPHAVWDVVRHSSCTRLVTRGEDELWITPFAVIGHVRRQYDHADDFCHADRARLSSGKPTRTGGAPAPRSGSGAAALPKPATEPACGARQTGDTMMMKPSRRGWCRSSSATTCSRTCPGYGGSSGMGGIRQEPAVDL
jgi:hypothetical protein